LHRPELRAKEFGATRTPAVLTNSSKDFSIIRDMISSINPATGETLQDFEPDSPDEIEQKLQLAVRAFDRNRQLSFTERAAAMRRAAELLDREAEAFGRVMTLEMGKTITAAIAESKKCATACSYYADNAERLLAPEKVKTDHARSMVHYQPIGVVLAIMPWNFPFWQVVRFAAPALMAGNVGLLKHASNVPQCARALEDLFLRAGFGEGSFQALLVESGAVKSLLEDDRIAAATLTGSEGAGRSVASTAGAQIKKTVLELGGSDPFIIMPSADLPVAISTAVKARAVNNGQSCIAAKRFIVHDEIYDQFIAGFVEQMEALRVGDPLEQETDVGPLATEKIREDLERQVNESVSAGAKLLTGGKRLRNAGFFYAPTVLTDIPKGAPAYSEELFGPVAAVFRVPDVRSAIELANDTSFGLGSSAWTRDKAERERFVEQLEAGQVFINSMVASDTRLPFGGVKRSGYGRELGEQGIREFVNVKTVVDD
jgi:succinate-semialdehyde dehydrogenase/glutarate-semialdehyde dehydrogenase